MEQDTRRAITIRRATPEERRAKFPPPFGGTRRVRVPKYVVVSVEHDGICTVFGLPQGGDTRTEAVFWAERMASKNGLRYVAASGWENVRGALSMSKVSSASPPKEAAAADGTLNPPTAGVPLAPLLVHRPGRVVA